MNFTTKSLFSFALLLSFSCFPMDFSGLLTGGGGVSSHNSVGMTLSRFQGVSFAQPSQQPSHEEDEADRSAQNFAGQPADILMVEPARKSFVPLAKTFGKFGVGVAAMLGTKRLLRPLEQTDFYYMTGQSPVNPLAYLSQEQVINGSQSLINGIATVKSFENNTNHTLEETGYTGPSLDIFNHPIKTLREMTTNRFWRQVAPVVATGIGLGIHATVKNTVNGVRNSMVSQVADRVIGTVFNDVVDYYNPAALIEGSPHAAKACVVLAGYTCYKLNPGLGGRPQFSGVDERSPILKTEEEQMNDSNIIFLKNLGYTIVGSQVAGLFLQLGQSELPEDGLAQSAVLTTTMIGCALAKSFTKSIGEDSEQLYTNALKNEIAKRNFIKAVGVSAAFLQATQLLRNPDEATLLMVPALLYALGKKSNEAEQQEELADATATVIAQGLSVEDVPVMTFWQKIKAWRQAISEKIQQLPTRSADLYSTILFFYNVL